MSKLPKTGKAPSDKTGSDTVATVGVASTPLTRRKFIGTSLVAGAALTTSAQQARPQPASKRTIVDAQVHFWKASSPDWPWDPGVRPQLPEPFTIERALPMMDEAGVDRVVIVPPGLNDRNDYALEAVKRYPTRFRVMGKVPLQDPESLAPSWAARYPEKNRVHPIKIHSFFCNNFAVCSFCAKT